MGRYIPDTLSEQEAMLKDIGLKSIDDLYGMVPENVRLNELAIPVGKSEYEVSEEIRKLAGENKVYETIFRGAGAYKHYRQNHNFQGRICHQLYSLSG